MRMTHRRRFRHLQLAICEPRLLLTSSIGFADWNVDCCASEESIELATGDLDSDGDLDLVVGARANGKIGWHENLDGKGMFGALQVIGFYPGTIAEIAIEIHDIDGDQDQDVVAVISTANRVVWFENLNGRGEFGAERLVDNNQSPTALTAADIDRDGDLDLVAGFSLAGIVWYENIAGTGTFGDSHQIIADIESPRSVHVGDVDGDGDLDLLSSSPYDGKIAWYENLNGHGDFGPQILIGTESRAFSAILIDIDQDGDLDTVATGQNGVAWYENLNGAGDFGRRTIVSQEVRAGWSVTASDFDSDGDIDIFSSDLGSFETPSAFAWHENIDGQGTFAERTIIASASFAGAIVAADFDRDGDADVATASWGDHRVFWYENLDGNGNLGSPAQVSSRANGTSSIALADFDGDQDLDLLAGMRDDNKIVWYENSSSGAKRFNSQILIDDFDVSSVVAADVDGDGDSDVLAASFEEPGLVWYENLDSRGNFSSARMVPRAVNGATSVVAADLDGDGDIDAITTGYFVNQVLWYENLDGNGSFQRRQATPVAMPSYIDVVDLDGDLDLDLVVTSSGNGDITWFQNAGTGDFRRVNSLQSEGRTPQRVSNGDLNGDGHKDSIVATLETIAWYANPGRIEDIALTGVIARTSENFHDVGSADIDGDGDLDVYATTNKSFQWFENLDGRGEFGQVQIITSEPFGSRSTWASAMADVDDDGDLDGVSASFDRIAWHEQRVLGDVNDDGNFDSSDFVRVFQAGEYEDQIPRNSSFLEGDWNDDQEFDSSDLVRVFQVGHYESDPALSIAKVAAAIDQIFELDEEISGTRKLKR